MSIVGIGTDLVAIERLAAMQAEYGERLAVRLLAASEMPAYQSALAAGGAAAAALLARRFAAKEAGAKALGCGIGAEAGFHDLVIGHDERGAPALRLTGRAARRAAHLGVARSHLSISDERDHALAMVVLEGAA